MNVIGGSSRLIKEKCGVIGVASVKGGKPITGGLYQGLYALQHRGQESAGIYVFNGKSIAGYKGMGLVSEVFNAERLKGLSGFTGIGHVRYSTTASSTVEEAQPFLYESSRFAFAVAFNGTISNFIDLRLKLSEKGYTFKTDTDTEVLATLIIHYLLEVGDYVEAIKLSLQAMEGAYSAVLLSGNGEIYAFRDPLGFKPLCLGATEEQVVVASESCALESLGAQYLGSVEPGELVEIGSDGVKRTQLAKADRRARCMFEYVYFSSPASVFDGVWIYQARENIGRELARTQPVEADVVVPVPDSGRSAALGYSQALGIPMAEGLMKNRYVGRVFITPNEKSREEMVRLKLIPIRPLINGRRVVLIDDSIVRGTTMKRIVNLVRSAGAKEVHVRISCPPIVAGCYMGIDFPTRRELIAFTRSVDEIKGLIGADSLGYNTLDGLIKGIGLPENELCLACLTGSYPIKPTVRLSELEEALGLMRRR